MGKFFGSVTFFLIALIFVYFLNLSTAEFLAQQYASKDPNFEAPHLIAAFELLHHPFEYLWVVPSWLIAGFIGGIITRSWKGALIVSIITGFILSLTWIFLMWRYIPSYWAEFISTRTTLAILGQTFGTGLLLGFFSAGTAICGAYITTPQKKALKQAPIREIQTICPNCGTIFQSKPKFCYKCNTILDFSEN